MILGGIPLGLRPVPALKVTMVEADLRCVRLNFETRDPAAAEFEAGDFGAPVGLGGTVAPLKEIE
jgi:hypothetical protein